MPISLPCSKTKLNACAPCIIEGAVRQIWHRGDERGACSVLEADSEGAAREIIGSLPLVRAGMLELVNLIPLLPYRGFGPRS